jgi:hypothetical protein
MEGSRSFEEADGEREKSWAGTPPRKKSWARSAVRGEEKNRKLYNF